jgi:hypothetical protein
MRAILSGIVFLWLFADSQRAAEDEGLESARAKLQAVRKQLEELRQEEQTLLKQLAAQEAAKRSEGYIKAEVKGVLRYEGVYFHPFAGGPDGHLIKSWTITVEDTKWVLYFRDNKAFLDLAKSNEGKRVVVTGTVGTRKAFIPPKNPFKYEPPPPTPTGLSVATFEATAK